MRIVDWAKKLDPLKLLEQANYDNCDCIDVCSINMGSKNSKNSANSGNVYLEIEIGGTQIGNVVIELYDSWVLSDSS